MTEPETRTESSPSAPDPPNMSGTGLIPFLFLNPAFLRPSRTSPHKYAWDLLFSTPKPNDEELGRAKFAGKNVLITGANSGVGLACAQKLARYGAKLILTTRSQAKAQVAMEVCKEAVGKERARNLTIATLNLDMGSWESIRNFKKEVEQLDEPLHYAILNAGSYHEEFRVSKDTGWEMSTQVHVLANAALSLVILPVLAGFSGDTEAPARLLQISSEAHGWAKVPKKGISAGQVLADLNTAAKYKGWERYHLTKLLNVLWTFEIAKRIDKDKSKVMVALGTPGYTRGTNLFWGASGCLVTAFMEKFFGRTAEQGSRTYVHALEMDASSYHGKYFAHGVIKRPLAYCETKEAGRFQESLYEEILQLLKREIPDLKAVEDMRFELKSFDNRRES